jgi:hypothetical protein
VLIVQALLTAALLVVVVSGLRVLMRWDYLTVTNARRVRSAKALGDMISVDGLDEELQQAVRDGDALFAFVSEGCPCDLAIVAFASLARTHPGTTFVLSTRDDWPELFELQSRRLHVTGDEQFHGQFETSMYPYFLKTRRGKVIEFGIANLPEQVEVILGAGGTA